MSTFPQVTAPNFNTPRMQTTAPLRIAGIAASLALIGSFGVPRVLFAQADTARWVAGDFEKVMDGKLVRGKMVGGLDSIGVFGTMDEDPTGRYTLVQVMVVNGGARSVLVDPTRFELSAFPKLDKPPVRMRTWTRHEVIDQFRKDARNQNLMIALSALSASINGQKTTTTSSAVVSAPGMLITGSGHSQTTAPANLAPYRADRRDVSARESALVSLAESALLAANTLDPRQSIRGYVAFDKTKARRFIVRIPMGQTVVELPLEIVDR